MRLAPYPQESLRSSWGLRCFTLLFFDLGALVAMPAILDVEGVQVIAFCQAIEFLAVGVEDFMPFHLQTA